MTKSGPQILFPTDYANVIEKDGARIFHLLGEAYNGVSLSELMRGCINGFDGKPIDFVVEMYNLYKKDQTQFAKLVLMELLNVLDYLHGQGITKGCINPDFIILTEKREIIFSMLDLYEWHFLKQAFYLQSLHPQYHFPSMIGALSYEKEILMAPEINYGINMNDNRTDIFSAATLFEVIACLSPSFDRHKLLTVFFENRHNLLKEIKDKRLRDVIRCATERDISKRFLTIKDFRDALVNLTPLKDTIDARVNPELPWWKKTYSTILNNLHLS